MNASALLTDLYELTMLEAYFAEGMNERAVFELFVRKLPDRRNFLLAAGLAQVVEYLSGLAFTPEELAWLEGTGRFDRRFLDTLSGMRFTGDVDAMAEGTVAFADEPLLRVSAPLREAQFVESRVMNLVHFETLVASKAVRAVLAAPRRLLVDFGLRRAHGAEAALLSARASYLAGFSGTATVDAGRHYGIPVFGTMAHSYVQAHPDEVHAFEAFVRARPTDAILLIDTYDTERAAHRVVELARRLAPPGLSIRGVRIDSGDLGEHARRVRAILDAAGLTAITIFASGNLDEYRVRGLVGQGAPIDGFGIGTRMNTSADAPYLDCAYKLVEYAGKPRRKRSEGKATWPGRKQVHRHHAADGTLAGDRLTLDGEADGGAPLLTAVMRDGRLVAPLPSLADSRRYAAAQVAALPPHLMLLDAAGAPYNVDVSPAVRALANAVDRETP